MILSTSVTERQQIQTRLYVSLGFCTLITAIGLTFGIHALFVGHDHVFGTSREVPWGLLIAPYVFFACLATGVCIISSLGQIFRISPFIPLIQKCVFISLIGMAAGLFAIGLEVENPWRVPIYGVFTANPLSNIWWKSAIYTLFLLLMIGNYLLLLAGRNKIARGFGVGALVAIAAGNLNMNSDMALLGARGFWAENYMPLFFLTASTLSACAAIVVLDRVNEWLYGIREEGELEPSMKALYKLFLVLLLGMLCFAVMKIMGGFSIQFTDNPKAMEVLVRGDFGLNFWGGEIGLTIVLPLLLLMLSKGGTNLRFFGLASLSTLVGIFITFYDLIIVGQLIPHFHQYNLVGEPELYSYTPHLHEFAMVGGAISFFFLLHFLGEFLFGNGRSRAE